MTPLPQSRGAFRLLVIWAACSFAAVVELGAISPRGGRVGWGRLVTERSSWSVHEANDPLLASFIAGQTTLNIDPVCYPADPGQIENLCRFPLIFTNNLTNVHDSRRLANIREYLLRGGFIYIDRCVNLSFSLPQETFYERHLAMFRQLLPEATIRELADEDPIYRCYFDVSDRIHPVKNGSNRSNHVGIYGVFVAGRMVSLLSLANLQCGWPNARDRRDAAMRMIANIYVYAMTRTATLAP